MLSLREVLLEKASQYGRGGLHERRGAALRDGTEAAVLEELVKAPHRVETKMGSVVEAAPLVSEAPEQRLQPVVPDRIVGDRDDEDGIAYCGNAGEPAQKNEIASPTFSPSAGRNWAALRSAVTSVGWPMNTHLAGADSIRFRRSQAEAGA